MRKTHAVVNVELCAQILTGLFVWEVCCMVYYSYCKLMGMIRNIKAELYCCNIEVVLSLLTPGPDSYRAR